MKTHGLIAVAAFMAGLALASLGKQIPVAPSAKAESAVPVKAGDFNGEYVTQSADGLTLVVWHFESQGKNTADYGPTLKWSKIYRAS